MVCRCCGSELQTLSDLRLASESNFRPDDVPDPLLVLLSPCVFTLGGGGGRAEIFIYFLSNIIWRRGGNLWTRTPNRKVARNMGILFP